MPYIFTRFRPFSLFLSFDIYRWFIEFLIGIYGHSIHFSFVVVFFVFVLHSVYSRGRQLLTACVNIAPVEWNALNLAFSSMKPDINIIFRQLNMHILILCLCLCVGKESSLEMEKSETCSYLKPISCLTRCFFGGLGLLLWLFVSRCQSCHIYHGRVPWGQRVAHTHLSLSGQLHAFGTCTFSLCVCAVHCDPLFPPPTPAAFVAVRCIVIAVLSPGAIMPHLSTESYDFNTTQHSTTKKKNSFHNARLFQSWLQLAANREGRGWGQMDSRHMLAL